MKVKEELQKSMTAFGFQVGAGQEADTATAAAREGPRPAERYALPRRRHACPHPSRGGTCGCRCAMPDPPGAALLTVNMPTTGAERSGDRHRACCQGQCTQSCSEGRGGTCGVRVFFCLAPPTHPPCSRLAPPTHPPALLTQVKAAMNEVRRGALLVLVVLLLLQQC